MKRYRERDKKRDREGIRRKRDRGRRDKKRKIERYKKI